MAKAAAQSDDYKASLQTLKKMLDDGRSGTAVGRNNSVVYIDYYDGKQLTAGEKQVLAKRGQPDIVINRVKPAINGILGVVQRGKSEPRAYPRTPKDEGSADVATDALRFIAEFNRFSDLKLDVFKDILVPGSGACLIGADADRRVTVEQIRWEEFVYDSRSRRLDFKDARFLGIAKWMYADDVAALYPSKRDDIEGAINTAPLLGQDESGQDRPQQLGWVDRRNRRLMVAEVYYRERGQWVRCVFHAGGILDEGASPYLDAKGRPDCPIEARSAYIDRDNQRYGAVQDMLGPQDEVNKRRSKALHLLSVRQIQEVSVGAAMVDADVARLEAAKPDGVIPSGWNVVPLTMQLNGQIELMQEAKAEIERMGPNPAILGRDGADASGRALMARQQSGLVELAILFGGLEDWELRVYRQMWARAKQYWTAPMWVRVTDDEGAPQFVGLNQPKGPPVLHPAVNDNGEPHPMAGQPVLDPKTGQPQEQPLPLDQSGQPQETPDPLTGKHILGYKNIIAEMDIDLILDTTPDTANIQQEQFQDIMQAIAANPVWAQQVPLEMMLRLSTIPHKKDVLDALKTYREEQQQAQAAAAQQQQQMTEAETASKVKLNDTSANKNQAETELMLNKGLLEAHTAGLQAGEQPEPPAAGDTGASAA